jgi:hypothetical protein
MPYPDENIHSDAQQVPHPSDADSLDSELPEIQDIPARSPGKKIAKFVRKHWILSLIVLALVGIGSLVAYVYWLEGKLNSSQDPTAAATENISKQLPSANTTDAVAPSPTESLEQKARADNNFRAPQPGLSADSLNRQNTGTFVTVAPPADTMPVDTAGQAEAARKKEILRKQRINRATLAREAHRRDVDTVPYTARNPNTGAYEQRTRTVQRSQTLAGRPARAAKLPLFAPDGVPYEDNDEVNRMLAAAPPQARDVYEQMTGHRYRPIQKQRPTADQIKGVLAATPGMDGFFTVKLRKADGTSADEKPVDVFFKCQINGAQRVVSGSVVALRLTEDAVLDGRTFPKNLIFAGVAQVGSNNVNITIERLGPARVTCQLFDYNYMPGIMIDPGKRMPLDPGAVQFQNSLRTSTTSELTSAIDRSASAANSIGGISAKIGSSLITRIPRKAPKLREILLPDGYPVLLTTGNRDNTAGAAAETSSSTTNGTPLPFLLNK